MNPSLAYSARSVIHDNETWLDDLGFRCTVAQPDHEYSEDSSPKNKIPDLLRAWKLQRERERDRITTPSLRSTRSTHMPLFIAVLHFFPSHPCALPTFEVLRVGVILLLRAQIHPTQEHGSIFRFNMVTPEAQNHHHHLDEDQFIDPFLLDRRNSADSGLHSFIRRSGATA